MLRVKHGGIIKDAVPHARHNNTIKPVLEVWVRANNALQKVWASLAFSMGVVFGLGGTQSARYNRYTCTISQTGEGTVSAYNWFVLSDPGGQLFLFSAAGASAEFRGPNYDATAFTFNNPATIACDVAANGTTYQATRDINYTSDTLA